MTCFMAGPTCTLHIILMIYSYSCTYTNFYNKNSTSHANFKCNIKKKVGQSNLYQHNIFTPPKCNTCNSTLQYTCSFKSYFCNVQRNLTNYIGPLSISRNWAHLFIDDLITLARHWPLFFLRICNKWLNYLVNGTLETTHITLKFKYM